MKINSRILAMLALAATFMFQSCDDDDADSTDKDAKYVLEVRSTDNATMALHPVADLTAGEAEIKDAFESLFSWYVGDWDGNGSVYAAMIDPPKFVKYSYTDQIAVDLQLPIADDYTPSANLKLDDERVWYIRNIDGDTFYWEILNTATMTIVDDGSFELELSEGYEFGAGFAMMNGSNLIFGFREYPSETFTDPQVQIAVLDGTTFAVKSTDTDDRSCGAGNAYSQGSFRTENGDVYFPTLSYSYAGSNPEKPSGFMRVKKDQTEIDDTYFLNLTEKTDGDTFTGALVYMGNNKVLVQIAREDLVSEGDYWGVEGTTYYNEWHVVDLAANTITKLDVPLSRGNGDGNPIMTSQGYAAFVVNSAGGNFIYTHNPASGETKQGLKYIGSNVIYKLHNIE